MQAYDAGAPLSPTTRVGNFQDAKTDHLVPDSRHGYPSDHKFGFGFRAAVARAWWPRIRADIAFPLGFTVLAVAALPPLDYDSSCSRGIAILAIPFVTAAYWAGFHAVRRIVSMDPRSG